MARHWTYRGERTRADVLRRDNYECQIRGPGCTRRATEVDHIRPKSAGGQAVPANLRAACRTCNRYKGQRVDDPRPMVTPSNWGLAVTDYTKGRE